MFTLETSKIPDSSPALTDAIEKSLRKAIRLPNNAVPVVITGELPNLSSLSVDVSNGQIDPSQPLPDPNVSTEQIDGPTAESFNIVGDPISVAGISIAFKLSSTRVAFAYARNGAGNLIVVLRSAADGHLSVELGHSELEAGMLAVAQRFAGASGVAITNVQATLTSISPTQLDVLLNVTAKKFVSTIVRISGRLSVNDQMIASATNLQADADGMVGSLAVGFLRPHLQKLNGVPLPLMAFSLGNVRLRGMQVQTTNGVKISAAFGSEAS